MSLKKDVRNARHQALEQLLMLRDRAKLQLHLLSMDARERWNELEKETLALEERASREGDKATDALLETANGIARSLNELMARQVNHSSGLLTNVSALMTTHVNVCRPDEPLSRAAQLMWDTDCGAVPVVDQHGVVALVTDRDICMATYTQGKAPDALRVESAMSKQLFSCSPDDSIGTVLSLMSEHKVRRLPVVNAERKLLGLIALADIVRWAHPLSNTALDVAVADTLAAISARHQGELRAAAE